MEVLNTNTNELDSIDDGCSVDTNEFILPNLKKNHSSWQPFGRVAMDESIVMNKRVSNEFQEDFIKESDSKIMSPHFNSTPSSSLSCKRNSFTNKQNTGDSHHPSKMSDFAKKNKGENFVFHEEETAKDEIDLANDNKEEFINENEENNEQFKKKLEKPQKILINKYYYDERKGSPGLKESKFKAFQRPNKEEENCSVDNLEENLLIRKYVEDTKDSKKKSLNNLNGGCNNMLEEILRRNLLQKAKKGEALLQFPEKKENFIEFYSDANINSSALQSENSTPLESTPTLKPVPRLFPENSLVAERKNRDFLLNSYKSDSEESIFNENENKNQEVCEIKESNERFSLRNRTKTLMFIGREKKAAKESFLQEKPKYLTGMLTSEVLNPMEKLKTQKELYRKQKKQIKKNDEGIQICLFFSELFIYISENEYAESFF